MRVDWSKPLETTPCSRNPKPVPCELEHITNHGGARVRICGNWFDADGMNTGNCSWYFDSKGNSILDVTVRNRVEETPEETPEAPLAELLPDGEFAVYGGDPIPDAVKDMFRLTQIGEASMMVIGRDMLSITNADGKRFVMDIKEV